MNGPDKHQRGVVTVAGAVFLIVVVLLMLLVALRMAASDMTDSALQNDGIDALFLAESGLQRAAYRYGAGTACTSLAPDGPVSFGRGTFTVQSAALVSGLCRVQVTGIVNVAAGKARRTVQADLRPGGGGGWAVGNGGTLLRWRNGSWNAVSSGTARDLNGLYCAAADDCWAVGAGVALHWNGTAWQTTNFGAFLRLNAVSCLPGNPNDCYMAADYGPYGLVLRRGPGGGWTIPAYTWNESYTDVTCATGTCFVTTNRGRVLRGTGTAWALENSGTSVSLNGVDCDPASGECWAVGDANHKDFMVDHRLGSWSPSALSLGNKASALRSVSCAAANDCWAVGDAITNGPPAGRGDVLLHWDGGAWVRVGPYTAIPDVSLFGLQCLSGSDCWAVGAGGTAVHWDGTGWSQYATPTTAQLNDVAFPPGSGGGGVTLVHWHEVVK